MTHSSPDTPQLEKLREMGAGDRAAAMAAEHDEQLVAAEPESCPVCRGVLEHVIGCPELDKPR